MARKFPLFSQSESVFRKFLLGIQIGFDLGTLQQKKVPEKFEGISPV